MPKARVRRPLEQFPCIPRHNHFVDRIFELLVKPLRAWITEGTVNCVFSRKYVRPPNLHEEDPISQKCDEFGCAVRFRIPRNVDPKHVLDGAVFWHIVVSANTSHEFFQ